MTDKKINDNLIVPKSDIRQDDPNMTAMRAYCEADLKATAALQRHHQAQYMPAVSVPIPVLDGDRLAYERHGHALTTWGRRERRIVANLIAHLDANGYRVIGVDDGDSENEAVPTPTGDMKEVMEHAFAVDQCDLLVRHKDGVTNIDEPGAVTHYIALHFNNGDDGLNVIEQIEIHRGDASRFQPIIDAFEAEVFA